MSELAAIRHRTRLDPRPLNGALPQTVKLGMGAPATANAESRQVAIDLASKMRAMWR